MTFYITFGQGHAHHVGGKLFHPNLVGTIRADNMIEARKIAFEYFGAKFCFMYSEDDFDFKSMTFFPDGFLEVN